MLALKQGLDEIIVKIRGVLQIKEDRHFELREGLICCKVKGKLLFYVPQTMENNVIRSGHDDMAYEGLKKVI